MDKISSNLRSENMRRIRNKNTKPELAVRSVLHRLGYRFRVNRRDLPGCPDIVFPSRRKAILVHGCFWHQHKNCMDGRLPKTRKSYWIPKLERNKQRDLVSRGALRRCGWSVAVVWECEISKHEQKAICKLVRFLES